MSELWLVSVAGGLLALDGTAVGQFMFSRPLVAGWITGWILGEPALGLLIGALLELYLLVSFPTGGSRFPEGPTATVVAVGTACGGEGSAAMAVGVVIGLLWGQVGSVTVTALRHLNDRLAPDAGTAHPTPGRVAGAHLGAIALDFLRGTAVTLVGLLLGRLGMEPFTDLWTWHLHHTLAVILVGGAVSAGIFLRGVGGFRRRRILFVLGLALGILGGRLL
ncbi:MAG: PTS sugar transporter subunit IIC [Gemmatimonadota bacterium]